MRWRAANEYARVRFPPKELRLMSIASQFQPLESRGLMAASVLSLPGYMYVYADPSGSSLEIEGTPTGIRVHSVTAGVPLTIERAGWYDQLFVYGSEQRDTVRLMNIPTLAFVYGYGGGDDINATGAWGAHVEGGAGEDDIVGSQRNDRILGGPGHDNINAESGNDSVTGDAGDDTIICGYGHDTVDGGLGND